MGRYTLQMATKFKTLHDQLLELKPEGASHDESSCAFCDESFEEVANETSGGSVSEKTYTESEYDAVVEKVDALEARVAELTAAAEASEQDAALTAVRSDLESQNADLQSQLDAAVLEASTHKSMYEELVAFLEATETEAREAAELEARKEERLTQVKEAASFPEDYLEKNADRFAAMSDETFELALEGFKAAQEAITVESASKGDTIPAATAMTAARTSESSATNPLSEVLNFRFQGVDTRTV